MPRYKWDSNSCAIWNGFCKSSHIYIVQFPTPPPQWGGDVQVVCGVAENDAAGVGAEQEMFPGESVWPVG